MGKTTLYLVFLFSFEVNFFSLYFLEITGVDVENPVVDVTPSQIAGYVSSSKRPKDAFLCERVQVSGIPRFKLGSYASAYRVTLAPSVVIPEKLHSKIQICFHK